MHCWAPVRLVILLLSMTLLAACSSSMMSKQSSSSYNEQLYIDARLNFAIQHPLTWQLRQIPTSSTSYRADTVRWDIVFPETEEHPLAGEMLIRALPVEPEIEPLALLESYLQELPPLGSTLADTLEYNSGTAQRIVGQSDSQTLMVVALNGQQHNFIIAFSCPASSYENLTPIFAEVVKSFVEILRAPAS